MEELLVQFHEGVDAARSRRVIEELGCVLKEVIVPQRIFVVACPKGSGTREVMGRFGARKEVARVEPNQEMELFCHES